MILVYSNYKKRKDIIIMKKRLISFMLLITVISCFGFNTDYFKNLLTLISQAAKEVIYEQTESYDEETTDSAVDRLEQELEKLDVRNFFEDESETESGSETGPYAYLEDEPTVGAGKDFTAAQKQKMLEENMKRNGGVVKSDNPNDYYDVLTKPKKSMKGVTPEPNEWQFDHIKPKDQGGTNSYSNCQIVSRKYNREKWNKQE